MEISKYATVARLLESLSATSVLDVGCRDRVLLKALEAAGVRHIKYTGLDVVQDAQQAVDIVADLSRGIPLGDRSVDAVVALDVLEHLDDLEAGLRELCRVAAQDVLVVLPNMGHLLHRLRFFLHADLGAKYELAYGQGPDRHRWLTVLRDTDNFVDAFAQQSGWTVSKTDLSEGARKHRVHLAMRALRVPRDLYAWSCLYHLRRVSVDASL